VSGRRWLVDPLDGTINFLYELPAWVVSVALEDADGLAAGVVHSPVLGETFCAARGEGAWVAKSGRRLRVRDCDRLERAMVATGFSYEPARRARQAEVVARLLPRASDIRRAGAAALDLAWVAAGRLDAFYESGLNPWDWAAGHLLVEEGGGVTDWVGGEPPVLVAAATSALLDELRPLAG
jgi:myo-inositol-1(or 4)-monophosphatase